MQVASAAPAVIIAPRAEARDAPSAAGDVVVELARGTVVCVVAPSSGSPLHPGWLAIRQGTGLAYVRDDAVRGAASVASAVQLCGDHDVLGPPAVAPHEELDDPPLRTRRPVGSSSDPVVELPIVMAGSFLPRHPVRISLGLSSGVTWISDTAAAQRQIDAAGLNLAASFGLTIMDVFTMSGSAGASFPSDHASFTETVVPVEGGGGPHDASSHLTVGNFSFAAGVRTPFLVLSPNQRGPVVGAVFADLGASAVQVDRSIANCVDCRSDQVDLAGGAFWRLGFDLGTASLMSNRAFTVSVSYQRYFAGTGLSQELHAGVTWFL